MPINLDELYKNNKSDSQGYKVFAGDSNPSASNPMNPVFAGQNLSKQFNDSPLQGDYDQLLYTGLDNDEIRAQSQSGVAQLGGALYNTGLELTLGTVSNIGRAIDFQSHAAMLSGAQDDANNFFSEYIDTLKEDIDYDIYRTHWSQGFNPLSTGWWGDMMPQLASSLSMAIPAMGITKVASGLGMVGRLGKGIASARRLPGMATAISEAGGIKNLSQGIIGGLASRSIESLAEASQTYKGTYEEVMNAIGDEEIARQAASDAAHSTYRYNWLLAASDMLQYSQIMNGFSKRGELLKSIASEAGEEGAQFIFDKESNYDALSKNKLVEESTFADRLGNYLTDSEFYNSLAGGALGGGVFHAVGEYIENNKKALPVEESKKDPEQKLQEVASVTEQQNAAAVAGDKKKFFDLADDAFSKGLLESLKNNTVTQFKSQFETNKNTPQEQLDLLGQSYDKALSITNKRIKDIEDAENDWKSLKHLSPEARQLTVLALADNRSKTERLHELNQRFQNETAGNNMTNNIESLVQPAKLAWYGLQAVKIPELKVFEDHYQKILNQMLEQAGITEKDLPATAADNRFIQMRRDMLLLHKDIELTKPYVNDINKAVTGDKKAINRLEERAHEAVDKKFFANIANEPDSKLETLVNTPTTRENVKKAAEAELQRRKDELEKADREAKEKELNDKLNGKFYSPLVLRLAKDNNISKEELENIPGTGSHGRVIKKDIINYLANRSVNPIQPAETITSTQTTNNIDAKKADIEKNKKADLEQLKTIPPSNYIKVNGDSKDLLKKFREYLTDVLGWDKMLIGFSNNNLTLDYLGTELKIPASVNVLGGNIAILDINVEDVIEAKYNAELDALETPKQTFNGPGMLTPEELLDAAKSLKEGLNAQDITDSPDGEIKLFEDPVKKDTDTYVKFNSKSETCIQYPLAVDFFWISNEDEMLEGTEIYFEIPQNPSSYHQDNAAKAEIAIKRKSDNRLVGFVAHDRSMVLRTKVYDAYKKNNPIRFTSKISHKSRGKFSQTQIVDGKHIEYTVGEIMQGPFTLAIGKQGGKVYVPNSTTTVEDSIVKPGEVLLVANGTNAIPTVAKIIRRSLTPEEITFVSNISLAANEDNFKDVAAIVNEITYVGDQSELKDLEIKFYSDNVKLGGIPYYYDDIASMTEMQAHLKQILSNPLKKRNVVESRVNDTTVRYRDPITKKQHDSYNDYLEENKVLTGIYTPGRIFYNSMLFFDDKFLNEESLPTSEIETPVASKPTSAARKFIKGSGPKYQLKKESDVVKDSTEDIEWLKKTYPNVPVHVVNDIAAILADGGQAAWGAFYNAAVYLAKNRPEGVAYHEAFHLVFDMLLTDKQRESIYKEAKKEFGDKPVNELEELLAEKFKSYMLGLNNVKSNKIVDFFKRLYNIIADFIMPNNITIDSLFYRASNGILNKNPKRVRIAKQYVASNAKRMTIPGFTPAQEREALDIISYELFSLMDEVIEERLKPLYPDRKDAFNYADVLRYYGDPIVDKAKKEDPKVRMSVAVEGIKELYDDVFDRLRDLAEEEPRVKLIVDNENLKPELQNLGLYSLREKSIKELYKYGLPISLKNRLVEDTDIDDSIMEEEVSHKENWQTKYGEKAVEDTKLNPRVKRMIRTLPRIEKWNGTLENSEFEIGYFGLPKFVDFQETWIVLKRGLADADSAVEMIERLRELAATTKHKEFYHLANMLTASDYEKRSEFFTSLSNAKNEYVSVIYKPDIKEDDYGQPMVVGYKMSVVNANRKSADRVYLNEWRNSVMQLGANINKDVIAKEGKYKQSFRDLSTKALNEIPKTVKTPEEAAIAFTEYFNKIGIGLQVDVIKTMFEETPTDLSRFFIGNHSSVKAVNTAIQNNEDPFDSQGSLFRTLSKRHVMSNPKASTDNIKRGIKSIHTYANKSFLNKWFETYNKKPDFIKSYNKVSYWSNLLTKNPTKYNDNFNFQVLSETRIQEAGKKAKEYKDFNPADSLLSNLALFDNNKSDKAFYSILTPADNPVLRTISFTKLGSSEALRGLVEHFKYEAVRIKDAYIFILKVREAKKAYEAAEEGEEKTRLYNEYKTLENELVLNYHYQPKSAKTAGDGNAFKLQNFNNPKLQAYAIKYAKASAQSKSNVPFTEQELKDIESIINGIVNQEVSWLKSTLLEYKGLVYNEDNVLESKYLNVPNIENFLYHYMYNKMLANMEMSNLFMGGAEYYKKDGKSDFAIVDPAKRATQLSAPGEDQNPVGGRNGDKFRMIVIKTDKVTSKLDGKSKIDYTDATSFITWSRFSDIIRGTGRFTKEYAKHSNQLKDGQMTKTGEVEVQPIKGHYFGQILSPITGLQIPTQIKSASTTLLKSLTAKNDTLEAIRKYMEKYEIDEAVYDSAVKVGLREVVTLEQILNDSNGKEEHKPYTYTMEKRNWKWQQNVPEHHISHEILMGTQIRKLVIAGIDTNSDEKIYDVEGTMMSGKEVFDLYQDLTVRNVNEDLNNLMDDVSDDTKLFNRFKEEIENNNLGQNYELAIKLQDGRLIIPPTMSKSLEYLYNAFFNKVIKQKIRGGQFVQVTALGNEKLKFVEKIEDGKKVAEAEVLLPWWVKEFYPFKLNKETGLYEFEEGKVSEALLHAVGYRIPTESKYSMLQFKVVGFLPPESGSSIICPPEVVDQMGSDFDVDKLFVMFYSWKKKVEEIDSPDGVNIRNNPDGSITRYNKVTTYVKDEYEDITNSTKDQRNNKLLDLMRAVLNNPKHFEELTGKNTFDGLKDIANDINPLDSGNPYVYPSSQEIARINNMEGAALIGLAANVNIFHSVAQYSNLNLGKAFKNSIVFRNSENGTVYPMPVGADALSISKIYDVAGNKIEKALSQFLAAFVDNAKDPIAARLNINFLTFPIISAILLTGNTLKTAMYFVNQPAVKEVSKRWKAAGSKPGSVNRIIREVLNLMPQEDSNISYLGTKDLYDNLKTGLSTTYQKAVLLELLRIQGIAKDIDSTVASLRIDSSGVSPNISDNVNLIDKINKKIYKATVGNIAEFFINNDKGTISYPMIRSFTNVLRASVNASDKYFPWGREEFNEIHQLISSNNLTNSYLAQEEAFDADLSFLHYLHENYMPLFSQKFNAKKANVFMQLGNLIQGIKLTYDQSLEKSENLTTFVKNPFISYLSKTEDGHLEFAKAIEFTKEEREEIIDSFRELYNLEIPITIGNTTLTSKQILNNIIAYSFMKNGFKKSLGSFLDFIPVDITDSLGFRDFYAQYLDRQLRVEPQDFAKKYLRNAENMERVPYVQNERIVKTAKDKNIIVKFMINIDESLGTITNYKDETGTGIHVPLIVNHGNLYYELIDDRGKFAIYHLTDKLGSLDSFEEYTDMSIIPSNNITNKVNMNVEFETNDNDNLKTYVEPTSLTLPPAKQLQLPLGNTTREYTPEDIKSLKSNEIFVFGSNTEGRHGKGAALTAKQNFGAKQGQSEGLQGQSYAIITKDLSKGEKSISLDNIKDGILDFLTFADRNPEKKFYVTKLGSSLAGYSVNEIKNIFKEANLEEPIPNNVILPKEYEVRDDNNQYTNHSGGAEGSDIMWDIIGKDYGTIKNNHYWMNNKTPHGNEEISKEDAIEGQQKVTIAAREMGRIEPTHQVRDEKLIRNWSQVKYADAIFAVTTILNVGDKMNHGKLAKIIQGKGGTGYAVQMAINEGKPVYLFDQVRNQWFKNINGVWSKSDIPTLTKNFAGIGTREINEAGKQAIRNVYEKTFKQPAETKEFEDWYKNKDNVTPTESKEWHYEYWLNCVKNKK